MAKAVCQFMISFIIPAYNEAANLIPLLKNIDQLMTQKGYTYRFHIINDGSTDRICEEIEGLRSELPVDLYSHYPNRGVGEAFRVGFQRVLSLPEDKDQVVVTMEADNTSDLQILNRM